MKNGEEIVSVGGVMEPSTKNMGISASNSVLLDLSKVSCQAIKLSHKLSYKLSQHEVRVIINLPQDDKVWLQLLRGGLVETTNRRTGYSSFSGNKILIVFKNVSIPG